MVRRASLATLAASLLAGVASGQGVPPTPDPELTRPLEPLATFGVEPVAVPTTADAKPTVLRYDVVLKGLDGTGAEGRFNGLSTLKDNGRKAESTAQITARADEDAKLLATILRAEGYFDAAVDTAVAPVAGDAARFDVTLTATPGERYTLSRIALTGPDTVPSGLARAALDLDVGAWIIASDIESAEANVRLKLPEAGYPFATVGARDIVLDDVTYGGAYTLPVAPGPRSSFGGVRVDGPAVLPPGHVAVIARFKRGELFDNRRVDDLRRALVATSLYSSVSVEPVATGLVAADGTTTVDLRVRGGRGPRRTLAASLGYATGEGIKAEASYINRNRFPPEGALGFTAVAGTQLQSVGANFRRSNAGQRDRTVQASVTVANEDFAAYNAKSLQFAASIARTSTPIWQKRWTWSAGAELIGARENSFDLTRAVNAGRTFLIAALPGQLGYDRSDSLLDPTRGFRVTLRNSPEASLQNVVFGYDRNLIEVSGYQPLGPSIVLAGRVRTASIFGASTQQIAPTRRIYAGGGGSVRGFGYQQLGPKDINADPLGGRSSVEFGGEVRYRFGGVYGIVPFFDGGQVYDSSLPKLTGLRYGAGIGARYYTNFGPLRFDVATPLGRRPGESKVSIYISIGQAF